MAERTAHKKIAGICCEDEKCNRKIGGAIPDRGDAGILSGGGVVQKTQEHALDPIETCHRGGDAKGKGNREVAEPDRERITDTMKEEHASFRFSAKL